MIPNLPPLAVSGDTPVPLVDLDLLKRPSPTSNASSEGASWSLTVIADGPLHFGNEDMTRLNTEATPAADTYNFTYRSNEVHHVLSPATETTVNITLIAQGLNP